jgi:hypothetical protein
MAGVPQTDFVVGGYKGGLYTARAQENPSRSYAVASTRGLVASAGAAAAARGPWSSGLQLLQEQVATW